MLLQSSNNTALKAAKPTGVVVSNLALQSQFFLQDAQTDRFFQGIDRWTADPRRALIFYDVQEALYICRWLGLSEVRIVSDAEQTCGEAALVA